MFGLSAADLFMARLFAGVVITAAVVVFALENALSHAQIFI